MLRKEYVMTEKFIRDAVMIGSIGTNGFCFVRSGQTLETIVGD